MNHRFAAAFLGALAFSTAAFAGRPLQTEDAGVLEVNACEVEGATLRLSSDGVRSNEQGLGLNCGVGLNSQVGLGIASTRDSGSSDRAARLAGKTGLWRGAGDEAAGLSLAWSLGMVRDTAHGWKRGASALNLVASLPTGAASVHLNLGHVREMSREMSRDMSSRRVATTWDVALEHGGLDLVGLNWAPMVELYGDDRGPPWWNLGLRATLLPEKFYLDLSCGRQSGGSKPRLVTAGFKFAF